MKNKAASQKILFLVFIPLLSMIKLHFEPFETKLEYLLH